MGKSARRWIPFALLGVGVLYVGVYFWGSHSEAFEFLDQRVRESPVIRSQVGDIQNVRMSFLGGYREKFANTESVSSKTATMTLDVTGSKRAIALKATAKEINGVWSVSEASIDGEPVALH